MGDESRKIVLVTRRTRLQEMVARYNTVEQARFQAEHLGMDFQDFLEEDRVYQQAVVSTELVLERHGRLQRLDRGFLPNFLFPPNGLVVVLGQDGLVANTLKYLQGQPVLALNPDPRRWDGALMPFSTDDLAVVLPEALRGGRPVREVAMAKATLSDGQELLAVNDFFIGARGHVSARYELSVGARQERQSSSGIIVSTGLGSTGWLRSVLTGAGAVAGGPMSKRARVLREQGFGWDERRLVYTVREPFPSQWSQAEIVFGEVQGEGELRVRSLMPDGGIIFSDGVEVDGLEFKAGLEATVRLARETGRLLH